jgi:hypothetical protein
MPRPKDEAWFHASARGCGWELPARWQGWCALAVFFGAVAAAGLVCARSGTLVLFPGVSLLCSGVLAAVCRWKGEPPTPWRWGMKPFPCLAPGDETGSAQDLRDEN